MEEPNDYIKSAIDSDTSSSKSKISGSNLQSKSSYKQIEGSPVLVDSSNELKDEENIECGEARSLLDNFSPSPEITLGSIADITTEIPPEMSVF